MKLLTVKELSGAINIKASTLYAWAGRGLIPSHKLNGLLRFDFEEVEEWIEKSRVVFVPLKVPKKKILKKSGIDRIINKTIESVKSQGYNLLNNRGNQTFQTRKGDK